MAKQRLLKWRDRATSKTENVVQPTSVVLPSVDALPGIYKGYDASTKAIAMQEVPDESEAAALTYLVDNEAGESSLLDSALPSLASASSLPVPT